MRRVEEIKNITFICDACKKESTDNKLWYNIDSISSNWIRLFEKKSDRPRYESKHLTDRVEINLCCRECAIDYLSKSLNSFMLEIWPKEFSRETVLF